MGAARLELSGIDKSFGPTRVLSGVDLRLEPGEVHAVLGENGAGKSTLIKILSGALKPERGQMKLDALPYAPLGPADGRAQGVAVVYQEALLCPHLTVADNVLLGIEPTSWGCLRLGAGRNRATRALRTLTTARRPEPIDVDRRVAFLSPAERQLVAIAQALAVANSRVLILDEPTSSLDKEDVDCLFAVIRQLTGRGIAVLYVSHFLDEVMRIAERYTVLRDGKAVARGRVAESHPEELVAWMAGNREIARPESAARPSGAGEVVLEIDRLTGQRLPLGATLSLRKGEIVGIGGLVGSGRTELLRAVFGLDKVRSGTVKVGAYLGPASPARRLAQGVGLLSEDRTGEGLMLMGSVADNLTLSRLGAWVLPARQSEIGARYIQQLNIRCRGPGQMVRELSGGNQQKVALGRLLHHGLDVLLLDDPTRGIDVVSRAEVHGLLRGLAGQGKALLVVSSHWPELLELCDRIAVMRRGELGVARPASGCSEQTLLAEAVGT